MMKSGRYNAGWSLCRALVCGPAALSVLTAAAPAADPPAITKHPVPQVGKRTGSVTFTVTAKGAPPLTYQWHRDGQTWPGWTRNKLTLEGLTENDLGTYTVTIANAAGSVTSEGAGLTLAGAPPPATAPAPRSPTADSRATPPAAARNAPNVASPGGPGFESARVGQRFRLEATAEGSLPLTYQWLKEGKPIDGATSALFDIPKVTLADAGLYACVVSNAHGSTPSAPVILVVR